MPMIFLRLCLFLFLLCVSTVCHAQETPPGVIISHIPGNSGKYIGSPSICILPNGDYVASHDEFGPKSSEFQSAVTHIFSSSDKGASWNEVSVIRGLFWSNLFVHNNVLYDIGTNKHHGNVVIRKSTDGGKTWTNPYNGKTGVLLEGEYHTGPMPMLVHDGRIWRAVEYATAPTTDWGKRYSAMVISAPVNADLLDAGSWQKSNHLMYDPTYLDGRFGGWLEGNVVINPKGKILNLLRVDVPTGSDEYAAVVEISKNGEKASFNPNTGFVKFPGGSKKFTIRFDPQSKRYWTIHNVVDEQYRDKRKPSGCRNIQALSSSTDLHTWQTHEILLQHPDVECHGFQYIDWQFEGTDIIYASRTAFDDETGGAPNFHDANYLTFHRIKDFRMTANNEVDNQKETAPVRVLLITGGHDFERKPFDALMKSLPGIVVTEVKHPDALTMLRPENRASYDVVLLYDMPKTINDQEKKDFTDCLKAGKGLVVLHHAVWSYQGWPEYKDIIGGRCENLPWTDHKGESYPASIYKHDVQFRVKVADEKHPITKGIKDFDIVDETYGICCVNPGVHVLLVTDEPTSTSSVAWTNHYGKSKVVTIMLGHDQQAWNNPNFKTLLSQAIHWTK